MSHHDPFAPVDGGVSARTVGQDPDGNGERDHLEGMRKQELQNLAGTLGLDTDGTRDRLISRIRDAQRQQAAPESTSELPVEQQTAFDG